MGQRWSWKGIPNIKERKECARIVQGSGVAITGRMMLKRIANIRVDIDQWLHKQLFDNAATKRDPRSAARNDQTTAPVVLQAHLAANPQSQSEQLAYQSPAAVDLDNTRARTHGQNTEWYRFHDGLLHCHTPE
jgi:hypothetical protein